MYRWRNSIGVFLLKGKFNTILIIFEKHQSLLLEKCIFVSTMSITEWQQRKDKTWTLSVGCKANSSEDKQKVSSSTSEVDFLRQTGRAWINFARAWNSSCLSKILTEIRMWSRVHTAIQRSNVSVFGDAFVVMHTIADVISVPLRSCIPCARNILSRRNVLHISIKNCCSTHSDLPLLISMASQDQTSLGSLSTRSERHRK
jgi:hypothetical protein